MVIAVNFYRDNLDKLVWDTKGKCYLNKNAGDL